MTRNEDHPIPAGKPLKRYEHTAQWITFLLFLLALIGLGTSLSDDANASPDPQCGQQARCSYGPPSGPGLVYCPDGGYVNQYQGACPSLWVGPYQPGGLVPNGGTDLAP